MDLSDDTVVVSDDIVADIVPTIRELLHRPKLSDDAVEFVCTLIEVVEQVGYRNGLIAGGRTGIAAMRDEERAADLQETIDVEVALIDTVTDELIGKLKQYTLSMQKN